MVAAVNKEDVPLAYGQAAGPTGTAECGIVGALRESATELGRLMEEIK